MVASVPPAGVSKGLLRESVEGQRLRSLADRGLAGVELIVLNSRARATPCASGATRPWRVGSFRTQQFTFFPSMALLHRLPSPIVTRGDILELPQDDQKLFDFFDQKDTQAKLNKDMVLSRKKNPVHTL